jgi:pimeloyl-ACP methyl ester carboxylesterase
MPSFKSFDGTRIVFRDQGRGPAVILIHGFGVSGSQNFGDFDGLLPLFEKSNAIFKAEFGHAPPNPTAPDEGRAGLIAALLSAGARVIVPDMRGFGGSEKPVSTEAYINSAMARDIVALIEYLHLNDVGVLGFSMGAVVVAKLLVLAPPQLKAAVLTGVGDYILAGVPMNLPKHWPIPDYLPRPLTMRAHALAGADVLDGGEVVAGNLLSGSVITARVPGVDPKAWAAALRGELAEQVTKDEVHSIKVPVLIVNGTGDVANQSVEQLLRGISTATTASCDGDHGSTPYQPTFQRVVCQFFRDRLGIGDELRQ